MSTESGVYLLNDKVLVVYTDGGRSYISSKPPLNLRMSPVLAERLRSPTETERETILADDATIQWLTAQVGRSPEVRRTINNFLGV